MNLLNNVILEGTVAKDVSYKDLGEGKKLCTFKVAHTRLFEGSIAETSYFDCEMYGIMAEQLHSKIKTGKGIRVVGRLKYKVFTDCEGREISSVVIVCEHIEFRIN